MILAVLLSLLISTTIVIVIAVANNSSLESLEQSIDLHIPFHIASWFDMSNQILHEVVKTRFVGDLL